MMIPRSNRTYLISATVGIICVLLFGALHLAGHHYLRQFTTDDSVAAFDLDSEGNLATWFNSIVLFLCGQVTLLLWYAARFPERLPRSANAKVPHSGGLLACAILWFTMSADEGGSLHEGFKELMVLLCGTRLLGDGSLYWIVPYFLALSAVGLFLLSHMGRSLAGGLLLAAGGLWAFAVLNQLELVFTEPHVGTLVEESCETLGSLCVLGSLSLFARDRLGRNEHDRQA
jgi:hypothetical protein